MSPVGAKYTVGRIEKFSYRGSDTYLEFCRMGKSLAAVFSVERGASPVVGTVLIVVPWHEMSWSVQKLLAVLWLGRLV